EKARGPSRVMPTKVGIHGWRRAGHGPNLRRHCSCSRGARLLRRVRVLSITADGAAQAEKISQCRPFVLPAEDAPLLQFRDHHVDEIIEAGREDGGHEIEAIARAVVEPALHFLSDILR